MSAFSLQDRDAWLNLAPHHRVGELSIFWISSSEMSISQVSAKSILCSKMEHAATAYLRRSHSQEGPSGGTSLSRTSSSPAQSLRNRSLLPDADASDDSDVISICDVDFERISDRLWGLRLQIEEIEMREIQLEIWTEQTQLCQHKMSVDLKHGACSIVTIIANGVSVEEAFEIITLAQMRSLRDLDLDLLRRTFWENSVVAASLFGKNRSFCLSVLENLISQMTRTGTEQLLFLWAVVGEICLSSKTLTQISPESSIVKVLLSEFFSTDEIAEWVLRRKLDPGAWWDRGYERLFAAMRAAVEAATHASLFRPVGEYEHVSGFHFAESLGLVWRRVQIKTENFDDDSEEVEERYVLSDFANRSLATPWQSPTGRLLSGAISDLNRHARDLKIFEFSSVRALRRVQFRKNIEGFRRSAAEFLRILSEGGILAETLAHMDRFEGTGESGFASARESAHIWMDGARLNGSRLIDYILDLSAAEMSLELADFKPRKFAVGEAATDKQITVPRFKEFSNAGDSYLLRNFAGTGHRGNSDGEVATSQFGGPYAVIQLPSGDLLVSEVETNSLRIIGISTGRVTTIVGHAGSGYRDGPVAKAKLLRPRGLYLCGDGSVLIADSGNHRVRRLSADLNLLKTVAGCGEQGLSDGPIETARFSFPYSVCETDRDGNILVADKSNGRLRHISRSSRTVSTVAEVSSPIAITSYPGDGNMFWVGCGESDDGAGGDAAIFLFNFETKIFRELARGSGLLFPSGFVVDEIGNIICSDRGANSIFFIHVPSVASAENSTMVRLIGTGEKGNQNGFGSCARLSGPSGICRLENGDVVVVETLGHKLRIVTQISDPRVDAVATLSRHVETALTQIAFIAEINRIDTAAIAATGSFLTFRDMYKSAAKAAESSVMFVAEARRNAFSEKYEEKLRRVSAAEILNCDRALISSAPRLSGLAVVLTAIFNGKSSGVVGGLSEGDVVSLVVGALGEYSWPLNLDEQRKDLAAISPLLENSPLRKRSRNLTENIFRAPTFTQGISDETLRLAGLAVADKSLFQFPFKISWTSSSIASARTSLIFWLQRVYGGPSSAAGDFLHSMSLWASHLSPPALCHNPDIISIVKLHLGSLFVDGEKFGENSAKLIFEIVHALHTSPTTFDGIILEAFISAAIEISLQISDAVSPLAASLRTFATPAEEGGVHCILQSVGTALFNRFFIESAPALLSSPKLTNLWCATFEYFSARNSPSIIEKLGPEKMAVWVAFRELSIRASTLLQCLAERVCARRTATESLSQISSLAKILSPSFEILGFPGVVAAAEAQIIEVEKLFEIFERLKDISSVFFAGSSVETSLLLAESFWHRLSPADAEIILGIVPPSRLEIAEIAEITPIQNEIYLARDWLLTNRHSNIFLSVWKKSTANLSVARDAWAALHNEMESGAISFVSLSDLPPFSEVDLRALSSTGCGAAISEWKIMEPDFFFIRRTFANLQLFFRAKILNSEKGKSFPEVLQLLKNFVGTIASDEISVILSAALQVREMLERDWGRLCLKDVENIEALGTIRSIELLSLDLHLLQKLVSASDLLQWLRISFDSDTDFSNSIEMAIGKSEGECPAELWLSSSARPDEKKITQLVSVRRHFHVFIYRDDDTYENLDGLVESLSAIQSLGLAEALSSLAACVPLRQHFSDLLSNDGSASVSNRLTEIYDEKSGGIWRCLIGAGECVGDIFHLEFVHPTKGTRHILVEADLQELHTVAVLHSSRGFAAANYFSFQISLFSQISQTIMMLEREGYPFFLSENISISVGESEAKFRRTLSDAVARLENWRKIFEKSQTENPSLNFFSKKFLRRIASVLQGAPAADPGFFERKIIAEISSDWVRISSGGSPDDFVEKLLDQLGKFLDAFVGRTQPEERRIPMELTAEWCLNGEERANVLAPGVQIIVGSFTATAVENFVSWCAWAGTIPDSANFLFCSGETTEEEIKNFLNRWRRAAFFRRSVFALLAADVLSTQLQTFLTGELQKNIGAASLSIFITSNSSPISIGLSYLVKSGGLLPAGALNEIGKHISAPWTHNRHPLLFSGPTGSGKSFQIISLAAKSRRKLLHFPVNKKISSKDVIKFLEKLLAESEEGVIHVDISDIGGTHASNNSWLWTLLLSHSLSHPPSGLSLFIDPAKYSVCVEYPRSSPEDSPFSLLPFSVSICQGNFFDVERGFERQTDAAEFSKRKIFFVCEILKQFFRKTERRRPVDEFCSGALLDEISGEEAYEIISFAIHSTKLGKHIKLNSYWLIWNFVDVLFVLLGKFLTARSMHVSLVSQMALISNPEASYLIQHALDTAVGISLPKYSSSESFLHLDISGWGEERGAHFIVYPHVKSPTFSSVPFVVCRDQDEVRDKISSVIRRVTLTDSDSLAADPESAIAVLEGITGVTHTPDEISDIFQQTGFCLTGDALVKIFAIQTKIEANVPVLLMGECGCGKTALLSFYSRWVGHYFSVLDVHGGTTEEEIISIFEKSNGISSAAIVFLDEVNTCAHMGLLNEALTRRSINGQRISANIRLVAALNPYRLRPPQQATSGLVFKFHSNVSADDSPPDPMASLVYRVHPLPASLTNFVFDFSNLSVPTEGLYVRNIACNLLSPLSLPPENIEIISQCIATSQRFVRKICGQAAASLRDVSRAVKLLIWFYSKLVPLFEDQIFIGNSALTNHLLIATVLAVAHVYFYRLEERDRAGLWQQIRWGVSFPSADRWEILRQGGTAESILNQIQSLICRNLVVESDIAMNGALIENLFVSIICILNKIPVILVGKPGTSKTLTLQVVMSNLQGEQSPNPFWSRFPPVVLVQYQCSPLSTAAAIKKQHSVALSYQSHSPSHLVVFLLDEIGLAEHSPDFPLKCLHAMLVDPPIAIVGLSNWELDPAKMNRAICLLRGDPSVGDTHTTAKKILCPDLPPPAGDAPAPSLTRSASRGHPLHPLLGPLARSFQIISETESQNTDERPLTGMRDYYALVKQIVKADSENIENSISNAICRNFGGSNSRRNFSMKIFFSICFPDADVEEALTRTENVTEYISQNLCDSSSRHLMIISLGGSPLPLLFGGDFFPKSKTDIRVLFGSNFIGDRSGEIQIIQQIEHVKVAMARGQTVILLHHENIYESLYDVLNQRYVSRRDFKTGKITRMLRLAIGTRSQLCPVKEGFKIIVVVSRADVQRLDPPFLNRFEKQVLSAGHLLGPRQRLLLTEIENWLQQVVAEAGQKDASLLICGFNENTLSSLVLRLTNFSEDFDKISIFKKSKNLIVRVASPLSIFFSEKLRQEIGGEVSKYLEIQGSLKSLLENFVQKENSPYTLVYTYSPTSHLSRNISEYGKDVTFVSLSDVETEDNFVEVLKSFCSLQGNRRLIIQCDPILSSESHISHTLHILATEFENLKKFADPRSMHQILFILHVPPSLAKRNFPLTFYAPWNIFFVDDVRLQSDGPNSSELMQLSLSELVASGGINLREIISQKYAHALSICATVEYSTVAPESRLIHLRSLLFGKTLFLSELENVVRNILERHSTLSIGGGGGSHVHVARTAGASPTGSLYQTLLASVNSCIIQAVGYVLGAWDRGYNILNLADEISTPANLLWFEFAKCEEENIVSNFKWEVAAPPPLQNYQARFPFSWKLIEIFENLISSSCELNPDENKNLDLLLEATRRDFGNREKIWMKITDEHGELPTFLHDLILHISPPHTFGLSIDVIVSVASAILRLSNSNSLKSPAGIHFEYKKNFNKIVQICNLLAHPSMKIDAVSAALTLHNISLAPTDSGGKNTQLADQYIATFAMNRAWDFADEGVGEHLSRISRWKNVVVEISSAIQNILGQNSIAFEALEESRHRYIRISAAGIIVDEFEAEFSRISARNFQEFLDEIRRVEIKGCEIITESVRIISRHLRRVSAVKIATIIQRLLHEVVISLCSGGGAALTESLTALLIDPRRNISSSFSFLSDSEAPENAHIVKKIVLLSLVEICGGENLPADILTHPETKNIYLNMREDALYSAVTTGETPAKISNLIQNLNPILSGPQIEIETAATFRVAIRIFLDVLLETGTSILEKYHLADENFNENFIAKISQHLALPENEWGRIFGVKCILQKLGWHQTISRIKENYFGNWARLLCKGCEISDLDIGDDAILTDGLQILCTSPEEYFVGKNGAKICLDGGGSSILEESVAGKKLAGSRWTTGTSVPATTVETLAVCARQLIGTSILDTNPSKNKFEFRENALALWLQTWIMKESAIPKRCVYASEWISRGCFLEGLGTAAGSRHRSLLQTEVITHAVIQAIALPDSLFHSLLFDPRSQINSFMPTMPDDEMEVVLGVMGRGLGWYLCPNGHPYSVGECTRPMQTSNCIQCGAEIGGRNHVPAENNRSVDASNLSAEKSKKGFMLEFSRGEVSNTVTRAGGSVKWPTVLSLRFIIRGLLLVVLSAPTARPDLVDAVLSLLFPSRKQVEKEGGIATLAEGMEEDWENLKKFSATSDADLTLNLHILIAVFAQNISLLPTTYQSPTERAKAELALQDLSMEAVWGVNCRLKIETSDNIAINLARKLFGSEIWSKIINNNTDSGLLWNHRPVASVEAIKRQLSVTSGNFYTLNIILEKEEKMEGLGASITAILDWHQLLFSSLSAKGLSRQDASAISNKEFIEKYVSAERQGAAMEILLRFCDIFNRNFIWVENLYECQRNPFLNHKEKCVDLSGSGVGFTPMNFDTPISFSIPSVVPGETDAAGLCTIQLLNLLVTIHNDIVSQCRGSSLSDSAHAAAAIPTISYQTPRGTLLPYLIMYRRDTDLLPALSTFFLWDAASNQHTFLLPFVEKALSRIVHGKSEISLQIVHFPFAGELRKTGRLATLQRILPQEDLPQALVQGLKKEIDTSHQVCMFLASIENVIRLLTSLKKSSMIDPNGSLQNFAVSMFIVGSPTEWENIVGPTVASAARIKHTQAIFMTLESMSTGETPQSKICLQYAEPLPDADKSQLLRVVPKLDLNTLLPIMRDFICDQLVEPSWNPQHSLKQYLLFYTEVDLETVGGGWYSTHFPAELKLANASSIFSLLSEHK